MLNFLRLLTRRWRPSDSSKASLLRLQSELEGERATADVVLVGMVTFHDDSILLLRRSTREKFLPGVWSLPAGKVAPGEPLADAALRELKEEAGVHGNVCRFLGTARFDSDYNGRRVHNLQINFAVEALSRDVHLDRSSDDFMWLPTSKLSDPPVPLDDFTRVAVNSALSGTLRA